MIALWNAAKQYAWVAVFLAAMGFGAWVAHLVLGGAPVEQAVEHVGARHGPLEQHLARGFGLTRLDEPDVRWHLARLERAEAILAALATRADIQR